MLKRTALIGLLYLSLAIAGPARADQWINPRQVIGDPWLARLQQGHKAITLGEKEELEKYGYTGLEVMTYLDANKEPGEELYGERDCLVIESRHRLKPNYYLSKRVSWVDRELFVDYHEEQFDRQGSLFKLIENTWIRVPPWNYPVRERRHFYNLLTRTVLLLESFGWIFDQGLRDQDFARGALNREIPWRTPQNPPTLYRKASDLPTPPEVRWSFWERLGLHPKVAGRTGVRDQGLGVKGAQAKRSTRGASGGKGGTKS